MVSVCREHQFKDKYLFYRFLDDDEGVCVVPGAKERQRCEEDLAATLRLLVERGPDATMRTILRKPSVARYCTLWLSAYLAFLDLVKF